MTPSGTSRRRRVHAVLHRQAPWSLPGLWTALVLATLSFTQSLLPRPSAFQGLVAAVTAATGYAAGVLGACSSGVTGSSSYAP